MFTNGVMYCKISFSAFGGETISYKGIMSETEKGLSIWEIKLFGEMTVANDTVDSVFENSLIVMITGPAKLVDDLEI